MEKATNVIAAPPIRWVTLLLLLLCPLILGANKGAAWMAMSTLLFFAAAFSFFRFSCDLQKPSLKGKLQHLPGMSFTFWACIPVLQLLPLPPAVLQLIAAGPAAEALEWGPISNNAQATLDQFFLRSSAVLMYFVALGASGHNRWRNRFITVLLFGGVFNAGFGLFNYFTGGAAGFFEPAFGDFNTAVTGTFINKNHFAGYLELTLPFVFFWFCRAAQEGTGGLGFRLSDEKHLLQLVLLVTMLAALLLSGSRGGVLAFLLASGMVFFAKGWEGVKHWVVAMLLVAAVLVFVLSFTREQFLWLYFGHALTFATRLEVWLSSIDLFFQAPILGWGAGGFEDAFGTVKPDSLGPWLYDHAHNDYVEYLVTDGLLGAGLLFTGLSVFMLLAIQDLRSPHWKERCWLLIYIAPLALLFHGSVDFNFQIPANLWTFFFAMGLALGMGRVEARC
jgi:O-antigen ligase